MSSKSSLETKKLSKIIFSAAKKDVFLGIVFVPLYSFAEICLAATLASLFQLFYVETPRVAVADLVPKNLQAVFQFGQTIDRKDLAFAIPILIIAIGFVKMISGFSSTYLLERAGHSVARVLRYDFLNAYLGATGDILDQKNKDATANQLFADTALLQGFLSRGSLSVLRDALLLVFIFLTMFWLAPGFMAVALFIVIPLGAALRKIFAKIQFYAREALVRQVNIATRVLQTKNGILTIFAQRLQKKELNDLANAAQSYYSFIKKSFYLRTGFRPTVEFIAIIILAILTQYRLTHAVEFQMATYSSIFILAAFSFRPAKNIANIISQWAEVRVVLKRLSDEWNNLQNYQKQISNVRDNEQIILSQNTSAILKNVSYKVEERSILNDVSLDIPVGKRIAFVGESGAGKSTAVRLLAGLLRPTSGHVQIDPNFLLATQEPYLFRGTVRENIVYATEQKQSDDLISEMILQLGLAHSLSGAQIVREKKLGFLGEGLSGGEKARVALARTLYAAPDVLLLDEPTANLDAASSELFWKSVDSWKSKDEKRTLIVVSHALNEISHFDMCYVFSEGKILKSGTPRSVLAL